MVVVIRGWIWAGGADCRRAPATCSMKYPGATGDHLAASLGHLRHVCYPMAESVIYAVFAQRISCFARSVGSSKGD